MFFEVIDSIGIYIVLIKIVIKCDGFVVICNVCD